MKNYYFKFLTTFIIGLGIVGCAGKPPLINVPLSPPPSPKLAYQPKVILVLGSGGARGFAHLGVLQSLEEAHIPVDVIVGASAGSVIAALYADNKSSKKTYDIMINASLWDFADVSSLPSSGGVIKGYRLQKFLLKNMHARTFDQLKTKLVVATTELDTGATYAIDSGPLPPAVLASSALPGAVKPVSLYGKTLIDGGVADPVPVDHAKKYHPKVIIAVNVSEDILNNRPHSALDIYGHALDIIWQRLTEYSEKGADIIIRPDVGKTGTFALKKRHEMYRAGYEATQKAIPKIRELLTQK